MHLILRTLILITLFSFGYISFFYTQKNALFDDTIHYIPINEPIYTLLPEKEIDTKTEEVSTSTQVLIEEITEIIETTPTPNEEEFKETVKSSSETVTVEPKIDPKLKELEADTSLSFSQININTREALVNIFCTTERSHPYITPISGSGVIIHEDGIILTNAHIAQFFLFKDYPTPGFINCFIRTGSPAKITYKAKLLYISPQWIDENAEAIATEKPMGTGEDDYAFLIVNDYFLRFRLDLEP